MNTELIGVLVLAVVFVLASVTGLNMGVLALTATFLLGVVWLGHPAKEVLAGFPAEMFVVLVAVTFLFGMARANGTVDWMVHSAVRAAGNRVEVVPWVLFLLATLLCATGAASPTPVPSRPTEPSWSPTRRNHCARTPTATCCAGVRVCAPSPRARPGSPSW
ncbi:hypothetical protein ACIBTP_28605 [Streptomyces avidinii]|uniref:hypothetical protein n=1 Tax=Streptomyces avidinii TaxID=1895 RepID=UPI0037AA4D03